MLLGLMESGFENAVLLHFSAERTHVIFTIQVPCKALLATIFTPIETWHAQKVIVYLKTAMFTA